MPNHNRRDFLGMVSGAAATSPVGVSAARAAEPPPETTRVRIAKIAGICVAPQYVAEEFLRAEGFTDIEYVDAKVGPLLATALARGEYDFAMNYVALLISAVDAGEQVTMLGGVHPGCYELIAKQEITSVLDLKGKNVGVQVLNSNPHLFLSAIANYVGLDPARDINWITDPKLKPRELFVRGDVDAFLSFPPETQDLRAAKIGHVILDSAVDRPWSQYFCCMLSANSGFVKANPAASKRVLRAILKAADLCVTDPEMVAQRLVDGKFTARYDYALQSLSELPYVKWRDFNAEDSVRFYALRLHEAGLIKTSPQQIIADGTDWRFIDELKRELKM